MYIGQKKRENTLNTVSYKDFYSYLINVYQRQFIEHNDNSISNQFNINPNNKSELDNYNNVIRLIVNSQNPTFTYDKFISHYEKCAGKEKSLEVDINKVNNLLIDAINTMTERFNSFEDGLVNVESYVKTGRRDYLTRQKGLRDRITNSSFRESLISILRKNNISFREYYYSLSNYQESYGRAK